MTTVPEIITTQQAYANSWVTQASAFIDAVAEVANVEYNVPLPDDLPYGYSNVSAAALTAFQNFYPSRPAFVGVGGDVPETPDIDIPVGILSPQVIELAASVPVLAFPTKPDATLPSVPSAPAIQDPDFPASPTIDQPAAPSLSPVDIPEPPSIVLPGFDQQLPEDTLLAPNNTFAFHEDAYRSLLLDETKSKLLNDLVNGGYGIEPADEDALWTRARDRESKATQAKIDEAVQLFAGRGYDLPPGSLQDAINRIRQEGLNQLSETNREIALRRSELYVNNRQFTIQQANALEATLIGYHNSVMERALAAARATLQASIDIFNTQVAQYNARIQAYQAAGQVFESRVRASLAQAQIYETTMRGKQIELESQRAQVEIYRAQLAAVEQVIGIYRARLDAVKVKADVERLRLETFRSQIEAYQSQVQAKVAEFEMFQAQIRGETARVEAYRAEVDAYRGRVDAERAKAETQLASLRQYVEKANVQLAQYRAELERYRAGLDTITADLNNRVEVYRGDISAYQSSVQALAEAYRLQLGEANDNSRLNIERTRTNLEKARLQFQQLDAATRVQLAATSFGSSYYQAIIASTLNSIGTLAAQIESA